MNRTSILFPARPELRLLHPGARAAIGSVAAASAFACGFLVFGAASDARTLHLAGTRSGVDVVRFVGATPVAIAGATPDVIADATPRGQALVDIDSAETACRDDGRLISCQRTGQPSPR